MLTTTKKFPRILPQGKIQWVIAILFCIFAGYIYFFEFAHPPTIGPFYKEYSSISELYKGAALGDWAKVTVTVASPTPNSAGAISVIDSDKAGVVFKLPADQSVGKNLRAGRNILYCHVIERYGASIVCEINEVKI